jgi:hypothetical protein
MNAARWRNQVRSVSARWLKSISLFRTGRLANQARAICAGCEVRGECLELTLRNPDETEFGVWGGTTR